MALVTSSRLFGFHFGWLSLSTSSARTPLRKKNKRIYLLKRLKMLSVSKTGQWMRIWWLPDDCQTVWQLTVGCLIKAWWLPDDCSTTTMTASWRLDDCLTICEMADSNFNRNWNKWLQDNNNFRLMMLPAAASSLKIENLSKYMYLRKNLNPDSIFEQVCTPFWGNLRGSILYPISPFAKWLS